MFTIQTKNDLMQGQHKNLSQIFHFRDLSSTTKRNTQYIRACTYMHAKKVHVHVAGVKGLLLLELTNASQYIGRYSRLQKQPSKSSDFRFRIYRYI